MSTFADLPAIEFDPSTPLVLLADLHGNLEALETVLAWLERRQLERALVLGDLVGYGASPAAVLERVRERGFPALCGNHEALLAGEDLGVRTTMVKKRARKAIEWTRGQLSPEPLAWATSLPAALRLGEAALAVHGSVVDPAHCFAYIYDLSLDLNIRRLRELAAPPGVLVFYGHTHHAKLFEVVGEEWRELALSEGMLELDAEADYFVNPGSVGYPRDGDPRASFMVWHPAARRLEYIRLAYDVDGAARRIAEAGYSEEMVERLLAAR